jgi:putative transposase
MSGAAVRGPTGFEVWGYHVAMVRYRRNRVDGGTYFFTVTLADRRSTAMVDHVNSLRTAFRVARQERPFALDAIVILPDHLHAILTLPEGDANFAGRWRRIKGHFSTGLLVAGIPISRHGNGELALWQRRFWEHTIRDERDFARHVDYIHYNPVKHGLVTRVADWPHSPFISTFAAGCCRKTGREMLAKVDQTTASRSTHERSDMRETCGKVSNGFQI